MICKDTSSCLDEINSYCISQPTGHTLLVNTENFSIYQSIKATLEADQSKTCIYVSDFCLDDGLPSLDDALDNLSGDDTYVLIGFSQAAMLRSSEYVKKQIWSLLQLPIHGHAIILLEHCEVFLKSYFHMHPDIQKRVVLVSGEVSILPRIKLAEDIKQCMGCSFVRGIKLLIKELEFAKFNNDDILVLTKYGPKLFADAIYSVSACDNIYETIIKNHFDLKAGTEKSYGTDEEWYYLSSLLLKHNTFSNVVKNVVGEITSLPVMFNHIYDEGEVLKIWLHWLAMKVLGVSGNEYLSKVLINSKSVNDFEEHIYMDIIDTYYHSSKFKQYYKERKRLVESFPENIMLLERYCHKIGIHQKSGAYYLTDATEREELTFLKCLSSYEYTREELMNISEVGFPKIKEYLGTFGFNSNNLKAIDSNNDIHNVLTAYFENYKLQKVTNKITKEFMDCVEHFAETRPYNMLPTRNFVINSLDRENSQLYFFDALGVEYLAFIQSRCEHYGLVADIRIACCELPSITSINKDFFHLFKGGVIDIKELDELKHHSQIIDYQQCKEPIHLFRELEIIDNELKKIQSKLMQDTFEKAIIVSDHGASRLAVINEHENSKLELEEKGIHSGRCCPAKKDPNIPFATYWNGYSVLANYDRFKGSRKANVEVHGGASLEEVLIPIISLSRRPADIDICFVNSTIILKGKEPAKITVFANIPLSEPKLIVNEKEYIGLLVGDNKHAEFLMPELKRTKVWIADFYDGNKLLAAGLEFRVKKNTQEQELFKKNF